MQKRIKVFYSWQSDTPSNVNRNFIEKALKAAINRFRSDAEIEVALRDLPVELDKDTQGVAGSPPIAQTILQKIEECAVFVADLTFIGSSTLGSKQRLISNPNVLIEYGYALRCHGHGKLVGIMNTAFGESHMENLPFDLQHLRWPITYELKDTTSEQKQAQYDGLVRRLSEALRLVVESEITSETRVADFVPRHSTSDPSIFFEGPTDIAPEERFGNVPQHFNIPNEGRAYLRLYPANAVEPFSSELEAANSARDGDLRPMGEVRGWGHARNILGGIAYSEIIDSRLYNLTQLFLNREIWGVDAFVVNATHCREFTQGRSGGYIASTFVEKTFVATLRNYLKFARITLSLPLPLRVMAGFVGVKGYPIALRHGMHGKVLTETIQWQGEVLSYEMPAHEILRPFFAHMWEKCGVKRGEERQQELAKEVESI